MKLGKVGPEHKFLKKEVVGQYVCDFKSHSSSTVCTVYMLQFHRIEHAIPLLALRDCLSKVNVDCGACQ